MLLDLVGHGNAEKPDDGDTYAFEQLKEDVCFFMSKYLSPGAGRNVVIAHSYGTSLTVHALQVLTTEQERAPAAFGHSPEAVRASLAQVILTGATCQEEAPPRSVVFSLPCFVLEWMRPLLSQGFAKIAHHNAQHPSLVVEGQYLERNPNPFYVMKPLIHGLVWPSLDRFAQLMPVPLTLVAGASDGITTPVASERIYQHLCASFPEQQHLLSLITLEDAGHLMMMEAALQFNQHLASKIFPPSS